MHSYDGEGASEEGSFESSATMRGYDHERRPAMNAFLLRRGYDSDNGPNLSFEQSNKEE